MEYVNTITGEDGGEVSIFNIDDVHGGFGVMTSSKSKWYLVDMESLKAIVTCSVILRYDIDGTSIYECFGDNTMYLVDEQGRAVTPPLRQGRHDGFGYVVDGTIYEHGLYSTTHVDLYGFVSDKAICRTSKPKTHK